MWPEAASAMDLLYLATWLLISVDEQGMQRCCSYARLFVLASDAIKQGQARDSFQSRR